MLIDLDNVLSHSEQDARLVRKALKFAYYAHNGQIRKFTGEDYWHHCRRVAKMVSERIGIYHIEHDELVAAAYLHDTLEDTDTTYQQLIKEFGGRVAWLVFELTDHYTPERYPDNNRRWRKSMEAVRLGQISESAKIIKLCDMSDNTASIVKNDAKFAITYLREKADVLESMGFGE